MHRLFSDLRFWILVFFLAQMPFIGQAPIDGSHTWRQTLTGMVSRNLAEGDNFMYPTIDHNGDESDIIGMEFPIYNKLIAWCIETFGFQHYYGRIINLVVSLIGVYCFSLLVSFISDEKTGFWAGMFLLFSLWFLFMRKIMPDTFSVSLVMIGMWAGIRFYRTGKWYYPFIFFLGVSLGLLSKLPAAVVLAPFGWTFVVGKFKMPRRIILMTMLGVAIVLTSLWYFKWVPYLVRTYHYQLYFPRHTAVGLYELSIRGKLIANQFIFHSFYAYSTFGVFVYGLFRATRDRQKALLLPIMVSVPVFFFFMLKTGVVFPLHNYYMIPFVPVMAIYAGYGLTRIGKPWKMIVFSICLIESVANMQHDYKPRDQYLLQWEEISDRYIGKNDLIICNGEKGPQMMYFLNKKGWTMYSRDINSTMLQDRAYRKAKYLVWDLKKSELPPGLGTPLYEDDHLVIIPVNRHSAE